MNSQQTKGAVIALHAILQSKMVKEYLLIPKDYEITKWERILALFRKWR